MNIAAIPYDDLRYRGHSIAPDGNLLLHFGTDVFPYALMFRIHRGHITQECLVTDSGEYGELRLHTHGCITLRSKLSGLDRAPELLAADAFLAWKQAVAPQPVSVLRGTVEGMEAALRSIALLTGKSTRIEALKKRSAPWRPWRGKLPLAMFHVLEWHLPEGSELDWNAKDQRKPLMIGYQPRNAGTLSAHDKLELAPAIMAFYEAFDRDPLKPKPGSKAKWGRSKEEALEELGF